MGHMSMNFRRVIDVEAGTYRKWADEWKYDEYYLR
jgi:hypothetical protein